MSCVKWWLHWFGLWRNQFLLWLIWLDVQLIWFNECLRVSDILGYNVAVCFEALIIYYVCEFVVCAFIVNLLVVCCFVAYFSWFIWFGFWSRCGSTVPARLHQGLHLQHSRHNYRSHALHILKGQSSPNYFSQNPSELRPIFKTVRSLYWGYESFSIHILKTVNYLRDLTSIFKLLHGANRNIFPALYCVFGKSIDVSLFSCECRWKNTDTTTAPLTNVFFPSVIICSINQIRKSLFRVRHFFI